MLRILEFHLNQNKKYQPEKLQTIKYELRNVMWHSDTETIIDNDTIKIISIKFS